MDDYEWFIYIGLNSLCVNMSGLYRGVNSLCVNMSGLCMGVNSLYMSEWFI